MDIKLSTPMFVISPDLSDVLKHIMDVSSALLGVLKKVKWRHGPHAGKSLYEMMEANGTIQIMQRDICQAIEGLL